MTLRASRRLAVFAPVFALVLILAIASAGAAAQVRAPSPSDGRLAQVLARARAAAGGDALERLGAISTRARVEASGLSGTAESWDDLATGRFAESYRLGPVVGADGFDGARSWNQEPSGQVLVREVGSDHADALAQAYLRSFSYLFPERRAGELALLEPREEGGRRFERVRATPAGGRALELVFDAAKGLLDHVVEVRDDETRTTFYSDYREVAGALLPFAQRTTNGNPKYDTKVAVEEIRVEPAVEAARFAPPAARAGDFEIAEGRATATVPFRRINNHLYVEVDLDGSGKLPFLFDTGGVNVIAADTARRLGLKSQGEIEGRGVGEKTESVAVAEIARVTIGGLVLRDQIFYVFPLGEIEKVEGTNVAGIVGFEVLKRLVGTIDYDGGFLHLTRPAAFAPSAGAIAIPFEFDGQTPEIDGAVDGIAGRFTIDTGSRASLDLHRPFVEQHGLVAKLRPKVEATTGFGVGGAARGQVVRIGKLELGRGAQAVAVPDVVTGLSLQKKGALARQNLAGTLAGNIGGGVLGRFDVTFDYGKKILYLEPNGDAAAPDPYDRAGLFLLREGDGTFRVVEATAGGPAAKAGLRAGDHIVGVDGKSTQDLFLPDLRKRFATDPEGTKIALDAESAGGKRQTVTIRLRELI